MSGTWIAAYGVLWAAVILTLLVLLGLLQRIGPVLERAEWALQTSTPAAARRGLSPGSVVPSVEVHDERGRPVRLPGALEGPTILLFMESGCGPCHDLARELEGSDGWIDGLPLIVLLRGDGELNTWSDEVETLYDNDGNAWRVFENNATPQAYVVDPEGNVLNASVPNTLAHLRRLARTTKEGGEAIGAAAYEGAST